MNLDYSFLLQIYSCFSVMAIKECIILYKTSAPPIQEDADAK